MVYLLPLVKHFVVWISTFVAVATVARGQNAHAPMDYGRMEDLSPFPTVSNVTFAPREDANVDQNMYIRPTLSVVYNAFVNFTTPSKGSTQIYKVSIRNDGPGDVTQLAVQIEDFSNTSAWWGLNTIDSNHTFQYLPKYRAPLRNGDRWTFGFIQDTNRDTFAKVEPLYGQTGDGRFFNLTSIIPSPPNPEGTNATLVKEQMKESYWKDTRYVVWSGRVTNTGEYPLSGVGVYIENITSSTGTWHLVYDPATNNTYLPLRGGFLHPKESQHFGFIMPSPSGYPKVNLSYVSTPNALYDITAPNVFNDTKAREALPRVGDNVTLEESSDGARQNRLRVRPRGPPGEGQHGESQQPDEEGRQEPREGPHHGAGQEPHEQENQQVSRPSEEQTQDNVSGSSTDQRAGNEVQEQEQGESEQQKEEPEQQQRLQGQAPAEEEARGDVSDAGPQQRPKDDTQQQGDSRQESNLV